MMNLFEAKALLLIALRPHITRMPKLIQILTMHINGNNPLLVLVFLLLNLLNINRLSIWGNKLIELITKNLLLCNSNIRIIISWIMIWENYVPIQILFKVFTFMRSLKIDSPCWYTSPASSFTYYFMAFFIERASAFGAGGVFSFSTLLTGFSVLLDIFLIKYLLIYIIITDKSNL